MRPARIREPEMNIPNARKIDLSTLTRDELQDLLSTAINEWKKYTNCNDELEKCKKCIEEERTKLANGPKQFIIILIITLLGVVLGIGGGFTPIHILGRLFFLGLGVFSAILLVWLFWAMPNGKKAIQSKIMNYQAQFLELQKKEEEAKSEFNNILDVPFKYWDEYALTTMLEYIGDSEASKWERVTDLYKEAEYRRMRLENDQMSLEEARRQTEILLQTRNAARLAAFGALLSAVRR